MVNGSPGNIVNPINTAAITTLGQQAAAQVTALSAAGARYILVPNLYTANSQAAELASTGTNFGTGAQTVARAHALYTQTVWSTLAANGVKFIPADFNTVFNYVLVNPAQFGITVTNVNTPACGPTLVSINCSTANFVVPNAAQTYFYADTLGHLGGAMQKIQGDYYYSLIVAPSQISFLAELPLKTRQTVITSIFNQIPLSWGQTGAFHGWASGDVSVFKAKNYNGFPDDPGTPAAVTAGFDYRVARNWLVGAAFSGATTKQSFSTRSATTARTNSPSASTAHHAGMRSGSTRSAHGARCATTPTATSFSASRSSPTTARRGVRTSRSRSKPDMTSRSARSRPCTAISPSRRRRSLPRRSSSTAPWSGSRCSRSASTASPR